MSERVTVDVDDVGEPVASKRATAPADVARLRNEARVLQALSHPGVVTLVGLRDIDGGVELRTRWHAGGSLDQQPPPSLTECSKVLTAVARTLADLHERGAAHGRIAASHVLRDADGTTRLCGFADATLESTDEQRAADTTAFGDLVESCIGNTGVRGDRARVLEPDDRRRSQLRRLARWAHTESSTPPMRALARALDDLLTPARTIVPSAAASASRPGLTASGKPPWRRIATGAGVAAFAIVAGALLLVRPSAGANPSAAVEVTTAYATTEPTTTSVAPTTVAVPTTLATAIWVPHTDSCGGTEQTSTATADVDGDGCGDDVEIVDGDVWVADRHFDLGEPGDEIVIGDWDCDGIATPALRRATTGEVFVFDRWASEGDDVTATAVPGVLATGLRSDSDQRGCSTLSAVDTDGSTREIAP